MSDIPTSADCSVLLRLEWRNHWLTPVEYARQIGRPVSTIWYWHYSGRLRDFSIPHMKDRRGRLWIKNIP